MSSVAGSCCDQRRSKWLLRFDRLLSELLAQRSPEISLNAFAPFFCCPISPTTISQAVAHRRVPDQSRRGLKRIVQPRPQIAIEEQLLPQQSRQCRRRPGKL